MTVPCVAIAVAGRHGVPVVEENAHGLFGTYRGRMLGTLGVLATQSFHETKSITCGEGGRSSSTAELSAWAAAYGIVRCVMPLRCGQVYQM
jgi:dTDP-4-amino-4,6-dideoxygalactose transaminase